MKSISKYFQAKHKIICTIIFTFAITYIACVGNLWCSTNDNKLKNGINSLIHKYKPIGSRVGISIFSISKNKSLYKLNSNGQFVVASNMKLLTTATALVYLGPDFEFKSKIFCRGDISPNGKLDGDIIIKGSGSPNISGRFYEGNITAVPTLWANAIKKLGVKIITGDIIADDRVFDRKFICDDWPKNQLSGWYCAQAGGLSLNDNCIDILVKPNKKAGAPVNIQLEPNTSYVKIVNTCKTTTNKSKHSYSLFRKPLTNTIYVKGFMWSKTSEKRHWVTIHNPPLYTATVFKEILESMDIRIQGKARNVEYTEIFDKQYLLKIIETTSTLKQSIKVANKRSQGFYSEQILKTIGHQINNEGSALAGLNVIKRFISKLGFSEDLYQIADGSGLSKNNKLTPEIITSLLRFMYKHKNARVFLESLPISGVDGTLKKRLKKGPYKTRIKAKTGYVYGVSTLSGYVKTLNNEIIAFSILVNKIKGSARPAKRLQDAVCRLLVTS